MNRGPEAAVEEINLEIAQQLTDALRRTRSRPAIAYASSTHVTRDTGYGRGKRAAGEMLAAWGADAGARVGNFILPHVFGEFGKPFYNSVVSTFCQQLALGDRPHIDVDGELELLHAQEVAKQFTQWLERQDIQGGTLRLQGSPMLVSELLACLESLLVRYVDLSVVPDLNTDIRLRLFNTLRSYLYPSHYPRAVKLNKDSRGELFEAVKTDQGGQAFLSTTVPGITRGNHWHLQKIERFMVIRGRGTIRIRRLFSNEVLTFEVSGEAPAYIDIPTLHTHSITNTGEGLLQTMFWANEIFDPARPDTYPEVVQV